MKKLITLIIAVVSFCSVIAQEQVSTKSYEKFRFGMGVESLYYIDWPVSTYGLKLETYIPVYKRLGFNINYTDHGAYFDYCDEIPVSVKEKHLTSGLTYAFYNKNRWTISGLAAMDVEFTKYEERDELPKNASLIHNEGAHLEENDHSERVIYSEVLIGVEVNYQLSERFVLNAASRLNTYGAFRNSINLFYQFQFK